MTLLAAQIHLEKPAQTQARREARSTRQEVRPKVLEISPLDSVPVEVEGVDGDLVALCPRGKAVRSQAGTGVFVALCSCGKDVRAQAGEGVLVALCPRGKAESSQASTPQAVMSLVLWKALTPRRIHRLALTTLL